MVFTLGQSVNFYRGAAIVTFSDVELPGSIKTLDAGVFDLGPLNPTAPHDHIQVSHIEILAIRIELTTTATGGNRILSVRIEATVDPVILYEVAIVNDSLAPSQSRTWQLAPEVTETVVPPVQDNQEVKLPPSLHVNSNQRLVIEDSAGIDDADSMIAHVMSRVYELRSL